MVLAVENNPIDNPIDVRIVAANMLKIPNPEHIQTRLNNSVYLNGMGFRAIALVTEIDHATIINWVKEQRTCPRT